MFQDDRIAARSNQSISYASVGRTWSKRLINILDKWNQLYNEYKFDLFDDHELQLSAPESITSVIRRVPMKGTTISNYL